MNERLRGKERLESVGAAVRGLLQDVGKRSRNPDLLDIIALPFDRWAAETLAGKLGLTPDEIARIRDS